MKIVASADATRGGHFRAYLRGRAAIWSYLVGAPLAAIAGAAAAGPAGGAAAGAGFLLIVVGAAWLIADRRAEADFFHHLAHTLGYLYSPVSELMPLSPLLAAGDRRMVTHAMQGPLRAEGLDGLGCVLAHYTYETRSTDSDGDERWEPHRFTVCVSEVQAAMPRFRGVYLRRRRGLVDRFEHDWLRGRGDEVSLESTNFNESYELRAVSDQDRVELRRLFSPTLVSWLAGHPLRPGFEFRVGTLVVFVPGHLEDLGRITWLLDATRHLARRMTLEVAEDANRPAA